MVLQNIQLHIVVVTITRYLSKNKQTKFFKKSYQIQLDLKKRIGKGKNQKHNLCFWFFPLTVPVKY